MVASLLRRLLLVAPHCGDAPPPATEHRTVLTAIVPVTDGCVLLARARADQPARRRYVAFVVVLAVVQVVYVLVPPLEPVWVMSLGAESLYVAVAVAAWWVERDPAGRQRAMSDRARSSSGESSGSGIAA